jgi:rhamnogalacturonan endolyase
MLILAVFDFLAGQPSRQPARGERLGRGMVALRRGDGDVFLGWRMLADDPDRTFFHVFRRLAGAGGDAWVPLTAVPIRHGTNYLDETAREGEAYDYQLQPLLGGVEGPIEAEIHVPAGPGKPYLSVPLAGEGDALQAVAGDLDGDGEYELVVKREGGGCGVLEAYRLDGASLWRRELDAAAPYTVFDLDGDGKAEVHVAGPDCAALYVAYLGDGEPHLIAQRADGITAYGPGDEPVWSWEGAANPGLAADVDGDGLDEIILGSAALDHDGSVLWARDSDRASVLHVAHILPGRDDLQVFYGLAEPRDSGGLGLLDAATGEVIWSLEGPTEGFVGPGMVADLLGEEAGRQLYAAEIGGRKHLLAADGREIRGDISDWSPDAMGVYWGAIRAQSVLNPALIRLSGYADKQPILALEEGRVLCVVDLLGDWREEIIVAVPGEIRVYTTTIPSPERRVTPMQDRMYRTGAARWGTAGTPQPQESGEKLKPPGPLFGW